MKKWLAGMLIFIMVFALGACSKGGPQGGGPETAPENQTPASGGTMSIASVEPPTLNPLTSNSKSYNEVIKLMFENLADYDEKLAVKPVLASDWSFEPGTAKCTVIMRDNIYWSDGQPITAEDVKFSLDTIKAAPVSAFKKNIQHIYSYRVEDDKTLEINFDQPFANAADALVFPVMPEHSFAKAADAVPACSGSYKVGHYEKLKYLDLVPNEKWLGLSQGSQATYIQKIRVAFINDQDAFSTAFQSRQIDMLNATSYDWEKYSELKDVSTHKYPTLDYDFIGLNYNNPIFQEKAVRKAIMQAIDRKTIVDKYLLGNAVVTDVPINPISWLYDGKGVQYLYSKIDAKNTLAAAGFTDNDKNNVLEREVNGQKQMLKFTLMTNNENEFRKNAAAEIQKNLAEVGISVQINYVTFEELKTALVSKKYDAVLTGYNLSPNQDLSFAFHSTQIASGNNISGYINPNMDALLQLTYGATDSKTRKGLYSELQTMIREEVPCISLFFRESAVVTRNKVAGEIKPDTVNPFRGIEKWYIPKNMQ